jgi:prepilin signal peptidase PulO-like enzyme (type II secretory pathway)
MTKHLPIGLYGLVGAMAAGLICWPLFDMATALWVVWGAGLLALALIDARTGFLPDVLTLPLLALGLLMQFWPETQTVGIEASLVGMLIGSLPFWLMATMYRWRTGKDGLGLGDVKLVAAMGAWSGPAAIPLAMIISATLGLIWGATMESRKPWSRRRIAFGPFLVIGYAASVLVSWYSGWLPWI